jgi:serine/threonine protein kinase
LNHPNITAIYGLEESTDADCLVLELGEGETLAERIRRTGPLPLAQALDYAWQIAEALEAAHGKGIIHRDLKPANVKVTPEGRVKVLDSDWRKADWGIKEGQAPTQLATATFSGTGGSHRGNTRLHEPGAGMRKRSRPANRHLGVWLPAVRGVQ